MVLPNIIPSLCYKFLISFITDFRPKKIGGINMEFARAPARPLQVRVDIALALDKWGMNVRLVDSTTGKKIEDKKLTIARVNDGTHLYTRDDLGFELPQAKHAMDLFSNPAEVWLIENTPISCRRNDRHNALKSGQPLISNLEHNGRRVNVLVTKIDE